MPVDFEALPELIKTRSAQYDIPRQTLCKWTFEAILDGSLVPRLRLPNEVTLDTEIQGSTYRKQIAAMLPVLENPRLDPCKWYWLNAIQLPGVGSINGSSEPQKSVKCRNGNRVASKQSQKRSDIMPRQNTACPSPRT